MLLPVNWLKDYIDTDKTSRELADGITLSGSHVESIYSMDQGVEKVVVGRIDKIEKHPDADKLLVCKVDVGTDVLQIVTGAHNIKEGDYVPVALVGAKLPAGMEIKETALRGVDSFGMLCSMDELGFADNVLSKEMKEGIFILDKKYPLGTCIKEILGLNNEVMELEITPNRPDCLSIIGMARETSATFGVALKEPEIQIKKEEEDIRDYLDDIVVESPNCSRYYARVVKDVQIKESPLWLQLRLMEAGVRPINNMVDITNYVMLEYGEPLHAFDLEKINGRKIIVRQAKEGEKIKTLDQVERKLDEKDLVIADEKEAIAIAGVMGGLDSEITEDTNLVLLEGANFNERSVRLTSKRLGLRTEASIRFEKGLDPNLCQTAVNRVCQLIEELGAGVVIKSEIDVYKEKKEEKIIELRPDRANKLLGLNLTIEAMIKYLNALGLKSICEDGVIKSRIPSYRQDLSIEADLIEEIGRLYGFHKIESKPLVGKLTRGQKSYARQVESKAQAVLLSLGYNEVLTYSFISPKSYDKIRLEKDSELRKYIELVNPLGEDFSSMRTTLISNMMELLARNLNRSVEEVFAFEIGNIFIPKELPVKELPIEKKTLCLGFYGKEDFYYLKETVDTLLKRLGIFNVEYVREENNPTFHPGRTANLLVDGQVLGTIGEIHMDVCENYHINRRVYIGQLDFEQIINLADFEKTYKPLPKYPSTSRDIAIVVDEDVMVGQVEKIILNHGKDLIEDIQLFDIYRGEQIPADKKSLAFSIVYRSYERTLKDKEVNKIQEAIIKDLEDNLNAKLRS